MSHVYNVVICQDIFQDTSSEQDGTEVQSTRVRITVLILSQNVLTLKIMFAPKNGCYIYFASYSFMYVFEKRITVRYMYAIFTEPFFVLRAGFAF